MRIEPPGPAAGADVSLSPPQPTPRGQRVTVRTSLGEVAARAEELRARPGPETLTRYREAVQRFVDGVVSHAYSLVTERDMGRRGQRRIFRLLVEIDEALAALAKAVLEGEEGRLQMLARLAQLEGLLLDLYR